jgi:ELWxxDGT repeat protein
MTLRAPLRLSTAVLVLTLGTAEGPAPYPVKDINPVSCQGVVRNPNIDGGCDSGPRGLTNVNGTLFFSAYEPTTGRELWKSDGTAEGTVRVTDINPGKASSVGGLLEIDGTLFLGVVGGQPNGGLWKTDGTAEGTVRVLPSGAHAWARLNDTFLFLSQDTEGSGLWRSDGTEAGTVPIGPHDLSFALSDTLFGFRHVGEAVLYTSTNYDQDTLTLWKSDGTAEGTQEVMTFGPLLSHREWLLPWQFGEMNETFYFAFCPGDCELWKSDGTSEGTARVAALGGGDYYPWGPGVFGLANVDGRLFFTVCERFGACDLWKTDGTETGTVLVTRFDPSHHTDPGDEWSPPQFVSVNGTLFFVGCQGVQDCELWKSDGTAEGTVRVADINLGEDGSVPYFCPILNGKLFFVAHDAQGFGLWRSDGTAAGTFRVGPAGTCPLMLQGLLFYYAFDYRNGGVELWKSDGTAAGTVQLTNFHSSGVYVSTDLAEVNGNLFFAGFDPDHGVELWTLPLETTRTTGRTTITTTPPPSSDPQCDGVDGLRCGAACSTRVNLPRALVSTFEASTGG